MLTRTSTSSPSTPCLCKVSPAKPETRGNLNSFPYRKPPLCKGRWHGEAVTEGLLPVLAIHPSLVTIPPSAASGAHPPLHKGGLYHIHAKPVPQNAGRVFHPTPPGIGVGTAVGTGVAVRPGSYISKNSSRHSPWSMMYRAASTPTYRRCQGSYSTPVMPVLLSG